MWRVTVVDIIGSGNFNYSPCTVPKFQVRSDDIHCNWVGLVFGKYWRFHFISMPFTLFRYGIYSLFCVFQFHFFKRASKGIRMFGQCCFLYLFSCSSLFVFSLSIFFCLFLHRLVITWYQTVLSLNGAFVFLACKSNMRISVLPSRHYSSFLPRWRSASRWHRLKNSWFRRRFPLTFRLSCIHWLQWRVLWSSSFSLSGFWAGVDLHSFF